MAHFYAYSGILETAMQGNGTSFLTWVSEFILCSLIVKNVSYYESLLHSLTLTYKKIK